jgi:NAD(P)-dependent dehydrogenase (short-subunit alcohol dehydrogenase family)
MSFAVVGLSESLAQEVGPLGIRVVLISPSGFATDWAGNSAAETPAGQRDRRPLRHCRRVPPQLPR